MIDFASLSIERPLSLFFLIPVAVGVVLHIVRYKIAARILGTAEKSAKRKFVFRTLFLFLAISCFILSYSGISMGTSSVPVQKSGNAVSFVFDISYSMLAKDEDGDTRLKAASSYACALLEKMKGVSVSVVLAKGDGVLSVPLTDDYGSVLAVMENLSPALMTSPGTSLGKGIMTAIFSFPSQSSETPHIWLFTDGGETDSSLANAATVAANYGISLVIIGFGSEKGVDVTTGDGKNVVHSSLMSSQLQNLSLSVPVKYKVSYIRAADPSSAYRLLEKLPRSNNGETVSYEQQGVGRYNMFMEFGVLFLILSLVLGELTISVKKKKFASILGIAMLMIGMSGCSANFSDRMKLLNGRLEWNRKEYQDAIADFLVVLENARIAGDKELEQYALYNLATTYLMQDEKDATLSRFDEIAQDAGDDVKFAVYYNSGILAHRNGNYEKAAECFKNALSIDNSSIDAKINLELSIGGEESVAGGEELVPLSDGDGDKALENAVYSIIREQEGEKWRNMKQEEVSGEQDY